MEMNEELLVRTYNEWKASNSSLISSLCNSFFCLLSFFSCTLGFHCCCYCPPIKGAMVDNLDYHNNFVGHYGAGDIQHNGHHSYRNLNNIYWKETKNFGNGCSSHLVGGSYAGGNMALPDQGSFIIEETTFGDESQLEANHHCNVGVTGVLCFPQYVLVSCMSSCSFLLFSCIFNGSHTCFVLS